MESPRASLRRKAIKGVAVGKSADPRYGVDPPAGRRPPSSTSVVKMAP